MKSKHIVSLLPSITEILAELGVSNMIVGITHECDHPPEAIQDAKIVTTSEINPRTMSQELIHTKVCGSLTNGQSLYGLNGDVLKSLLPIDIIFTQSLCDICAVSYPMVLKGCATLIGGPPFHDDSPNNVVDNNGSRNKIPRVVSMEPENLRDVLETFQVAAKALDSIIDEGEGEIGTIEARCNVVINEIQTGLNRIEYVVRAHQHSLKAKSKPLVAFLEWHSPLFAGGHWIPDMLNIIDVSAPMLLSGEPSKVFTDEELLELDPDFILIGPCGFNLERSLRDTLAMYKKRPFWRELRAVKQNQVFALDGNSYYARPGPRLLQGTGIMAACVYGEELAKELGEDLAPSTGYVQVMLDMYDK